MQALSYIEWNNVYKWAREEKILESGDLKLLKGVASSRLSGKLSTNSLYSTLGVYYLLKKAGFTGNPAATKEKLIKTSIAVPQQEKGFDFTRLDGVVLGIKEVTAKQYLRSLEGRIADQYINNASIGRIVGKSLFNVKKDLADFNLKWSAGKGYRSDDLLNSFKEVLEDAIRGSVSKEGSTLKEEKIGNPLLQTRPAVPEAISIKADKDGKDKKWTFELILKEGLENGRVEASKIQLINFDDEFEVGDYFEAIEELEDRGIIIE